MFNSGSTRCTLYSLFLSSLALHVSGAICTHHQEHNCSVQPWVVYGLVCYSVGALTLKHGQLQTGSDERNKEYSVHLVGPELNIYITKMYGTTNIK
jgi:hypothetical protein